ncbi:MAG TPA: WD40 repeat domain-containing protein, partial [Castellaniella sp.]|nr:WD40 repeat domain-containing protein [Castellaniella sp.]
EVRAFKGHDDAIMCVACSPDGTRIASGGGYDRLVKIWDAETGAESFTLAGHGHWIRSLAFSPDGRRLASASYDYSVKLWNLETRQPEHSLQHAWVASDACFSPDGSRVATASWDRKLRLWDAATAKQLGTFEGHVDGITKLAFSPDGKHLASCSGDKSIRIWEVETGRPRISHGHQGAVASVAISPDGKLLASGSVDTSVRLWDLATAEELHVLADEFSFDLQPAPVSALAFHPAEGLLASAYYNGVVRLWDTATGKLQRRIIAIDKSAGGVHALAFGPDGLLATAGNDHLVKLWNSETGEHLRTLRGHAGPVRAVTFSSDGLTLAAGGDAGLIKLWDPHHGAELRTLTRPQFPVRSLCFLPDNHTLAAGGQALVKIWNTDTGTARDLITGLAGNVPVAAHPAGQLLATSADSGGVKLWDLSQDSPQIEGLAVEPAGRRIQALAFTPEGRYLATGNSDGTVYVLRVGPAAP